MDLVLTDEQEMFHFATRKLAGIMLRRALRFTRAVGNVGVMR